MTEFKKGQKVRTVRDTVSEYGVRIPKGATGTVGESRTTGPNWDLAFAPDDRAHGRLRHVQSADFELAEPETENVKIDQPTELREGDVVVSVPTTEQPYGSPFSRVVGAVVVRREKAPEPPKPEPGTFGTATVGGTRYRGYIDQDGDFSFWNHDKGEDDLSAGYGFSDFTPDAPPALPTREALAEAIKRKGAFHEAAKPGRPDSELWRVSPLRAADRVLDLLKEARP